MLIFKSKQKIFEDDLKIKCGKNVAIFYWNC